MFFLNLPSAPENDSFNDFYDTLLSDVESNESVGSEETAERFSLQYSRGTLLNAEYWNLYLCRALSSLHASRTAAMASKSVKGIKESPTSITEIFLFVMFGIECEPLREDYANLLLPLFDVNFPLDEFSRRINEINRQYAALKTIDHKASARVPADKDVRVDVLDTWGILDEYLNKLQFEAVLQYLIASPELFTIDCRRIIEQIPEEFVMRKINELIANGDVTAALFLTRHISGALRTYFLSRMASLQLDIVSSCPPALSAVDPFTVHRKNALKTLQELRQLPSSLQTQIDRVTSYFGCSSIPYPSAPLREILHLPRFLNLFCKGDPETLGKWLDDIDLLCQASTPIAWLKYLGSIPADLVLEVIYTKVRLVVRDRPSLAYELVINAPEHKLRDHLIYEVCLLFIEHELDDLAAKLRWHLEPPFMQILVEVELDARGTAKKEGLSSTSRAVKLETDQKVYREVCEHLKSNPRMAHLLTLRIEKSASNDALLVKLALLFHSFSQFKIAISLLDKTTTLKKKHGEIRSMIVTAETTSLYQEQRALPLRSDEFIYRDVLTKITLQPVASFQRIRAIPKHPARDPFFEECIMQFIREKHWGMAHKLILDKVSPRRHAALLSLLDLAYQKEMRSSGAVGSSGELTDPYRAKDRSVRIRKCLKDLESIWKMTNTKEQMKVIEQIPEDMVDLVIFEQIKAEVNFHPTRVSQLIEAIPMDPRRDLLFKAVATLCYENRKFPLMGQAERRITNCALRACLRRDLPAMELREKAERIKTYRLPFFIQCLTQSKDISLVKERLCILFKGREDARYQMLHTLMKLYEGPLVSKRPVELLQNIWLLF